MAQTTLSTSSRNAVVEISSDGSTWNDISGYAQSVSPGDGTRLTGTAFTFDGNGPIITAGKLDAQESTIGIVYTEDTGGAYDRAKGYFDGASSTCYLRVAPNGNTTGNFRFTSTKGVITQFPAFHELDASSGDPQMIEFTVQHGGWTKAAIP
jgi:hypothetical protein